jgi:hypothetical protein
VWAIVETALSTEHDLMKPFWEAVIGPVPSQQTAPLSTPASTAESGPEDMEVDPAPANAPDEPAYSSTAPESTQPDEITVVDSSEDEFEDEPGPTEEEIAQQKEHDDFHKTLADEMAQAAEDGRELAYGLWGRVNAIFLSKKTAEVSRTRVSTRARLAGR